MSIVQTLLDTYLPLVSVQSWLLAPLERAQTAAKNLEAVIEKPLPEPYCVTIRRCICGE